MGEYIGLFFFIATSLLGILTLLNRLCAAFVRGGDGIGERAVLSIRGHAEAAEFLLRRYALLGIRDVLVIDEGMDEQTAAVVARFCERHPYVTVQSAPNVYPAGGQTEWRSSANT